VDHALASKRRTATADVVLGGHTIAAGQKVLVWEGSANCDGNALQRPTDSMSVATRTHTSRLGTGFTLCLGAHLARMEIRGALSELLATFASFELNGVAEWTRSNRDTGLRHLPLRVTRTVG
jgi:cytochrome P450